MWREELAATAKGVRNFKLRPMRTCRFRLVPPCRRGMACKFNVSNKLIQMTRLVGPGTPKRLSNRGVELKLNIHSYVYTVA